MNKTLVEMAIDLLSLNERRCSPEEKIKSLDATIDDLEHLIYVIQINHINHEERLKRAEDKKEALDEYIEFLRNK